MTTGVRAGTLYALTVFLIGFIFGTIRVLLVVPRLGETAAVILEAPVMLGASWFVCRWCVGRLVVPLRVGRTPIPGGSGRVPGADGGGIRARWLGLREVFGRASYGLWLSGRRNRPRGPVRLCHAPRYADLEALNQQR